MPGRAQETASSATCQAQANNWGSSAESVGEFPGESGALTTDSSSLFGEQRVADCSGASSLTNPRYFDLHAAAKVDRGGVQVRFRDCCPKIELVTGRTALEAAKGISPQMDRKNPTLGECGTVDRARATQLVAANFAGYEADQFENVAHGNPLWNGMEIDTRQDDSSSKRHPQGSLPARSKTGHREEERVGRFRGPEIHPSIIA